jgi:hypothetical protein
VTSWPVSSRISRFAASGKSSPICGRPPGSSHALRRFRRNGTEHSGEVQQRLLGLGFDPIRNRAGRGSIPAIPEQKTKPPATIAWLYGPSASGA